MKNEEIRSTLQKIGTALTGRPLKVIRTSDGLAYHQRQEKGDLIAINFDEGFEGLEEEDWPCMYYGLFSHEIMHALRTDSNYVFARIKDYPAAEQADRKDIWNIMEDPAIEYMAKYDLPDTLTGCLDKMIEYVHWKSPTLEEAGADAYMQYIASMIMFGDVGLLKGRFTFPEAYQAFLKTAPIILESTVEKDAKKRFDLSQQIFEIIRPLWEEHQDRVFANKEMEDMLKDFGVTKSSGCGDEPGAGNAPVPDMSDNPVAKQQKDVVEEIKKFCQKTDDESDNESDNDAAASYEAAGDMDDGLADKICCDNSKVDGIDIPVSLKNEIQEQISASAESEKRRNRKKAEKQVAESPYIQVKSPYFRDVTYEVKNVKTGDIAEYTMALDNMRSSILNMRSWMKKILYTPDAVKEYKTCGRVDAARYGGRKISARMFKKHREPDDRSDMAILILADQSGSMENTIPAVKNAIYLITEALSGFDVPVKVIGFNSQSNGYDATYYHYGGWKNTKAARTAVTNMSSGGSTFLGHAIRYSGGLLKKRNERNRILVVITDGEPVHTLYNKKNDGYNDCRYAVTDINKFADVIGMGMCKTETDKEVFRFIFQKYFIPLSDGTQIQKELPKMIGRIIKQK